MSRRFTLLTFVLFCAAFSAADILDQPHVVVYGTAEIKVTPNEMNWSLTVRNEDKELPTTAAKHNEIVKKVIDFLKGLKVDEDKLQTSRMHFAENWKYKERENVKVGYYASTDISFKITDFNLYEKLWFGLAAIEGVSIQGTSYSHSDRIRLQNESRQKAVLAAREKASAMAATLGSSIGQALQIEEYVPQGFGPMPRSNIIASNIEADMRESASDQVLATGQITISTQVRIVFELKNKPL